MRPAVSRTSLYSYLVTRHTGRAVRLSIEERLSGYDRNVLTVLDFEHVPLIDFSCADEVVAKLVRPPHADASTGRFFLFRGVGERHREPIVSALRRRDLAVAAEGANGEPLLLGAVNGPLELAWRAVWTAGRACPDGVAAMLGEGERAVSPALEELERRRLVIRDGDTYVSFRWALQEAASLHGR
jgi:hypothetical protein